MTETLQNEFSLKLFFLNHWSKPTSWNIKCQNVAAIEQKEQRRRDEVVFAVFWAKNIKVYTDWQTHRQRTDHPVRLTAGSLSQRTRQLSSTGFIYQLPHKEPGQSGHCRGCAALNRRSGPRVGHWPGSSGGPGMTTMEEISSEMSFMVTLRKCAAGSDKMTDWEK